MGAIRLAEGVRVLAPRWEPALGRSDAEAVVLSLAAAFCVHTFLCCFQSAFWQSREQYRVVWHFAHRLRDTSSLAVLAQQAHCAGAVLAVEGVVLDRKS